MEQSKIFDKENNNLEIIINGGITDCFQIKDHLKNVMAL